MMNQGSCQDSQIIHAKTVQRLFAPQFVTGQILEDVEESKNTRQALAWNYHILPDGKQILGHSGSDPGVTTFAYFFPDNKVGAILFVNTSSENEAFSNSYKQLVKILLAEVLEQN